METLSFVRWGQYKIPRLINAKSPPHSLVIPLNHIAFSRIVYHNPLIEQCTSRIDPYPRIQWMLPWQHSNHLQYLHGNSRSSWSCIISTVTVVKLGAFVKHLLFGLSAQLLPPSFWLSHLCSLSVQPPDCGISFPLQILYVHGPKMLLDERHIALCASTTYGVRVVGVRGNQKHFGIVWGLEVLNLNIQSNPIINNFFTIATWHPCPFSTKICSSLDLAENWDLGLPDPIQYQNAFSFLGPWWPLP